MNRTETIRKSLGPIARSLNELRQGRVYIEIEPKDILAAFSQFTALKGMRFIIISGIDCREGIELLYHFSDDSTGTVYTLRTVITDKKHPEIETVSNVLKGTEWIEREIYELLGVTFKGHRNLKHLLLPDDWPASNYPLRQDNNG